MSNQMPPSSIELLSYRVEQMHKDFGGMQVVLKELTQAIVKLSTVEQRQLDMSDSLRRAFSVTEKLESRLRLIELSQPESKRATAWVDRAVWALAAAAAMFLFSKTGLTK
jgi:hypothetical protein